VRLTPRRVETSAADLTATPSRRQPPAARAGLPSRQGAAEWAIAAAIASRGCLSRLTATSCGCVGLGEPDHAWITQVGAVRAAGAREIVQFQPMYKLHGIVFCGRARPTSPPNRTMTDTEQPIPVTEQQEAPVEAPPAEDAPAPEPVEAPPAEDAPPAAVEEVAAEQPVEAAAPAPVGEPAIDAAQAAAQAAAVAARLMASHVNVRGAAGACIATSLPACPAQQSRACSPPPAFPAACCPQQFAQADGELNNKRPREDDEEGGPEKKRAASLLNDPPVQGGVDPTGLGVGAACLHCEKGGQALA
jgi:hypothetical protein